MHQLSRWCLESRCQEILFTFSSRYSLSTRPAPGYTFHCKSPNTSSLTYCTYTGYYCPRSCWGALIVFTFHCGEVNFLECIVQNIFSLSSSFRWQKVSRIEFLHFEPGGGRVTHPYSGLPIQRATHPYRGLFNIF